jgi:predicted nucleic acid-binding protein
MKMYLDHMDKEWTLTDCTSIVVMRDMKIEEGERIGEAKDG